MTWNLKTEWANDDARSIALALALDPARVARDHRAVVRRGERWFSPLLIDPAHFGLAPG